jgi:hypothetical protein
MILIEVSAYIIINIILMLTEKRNLIIKNFSSNFLNKFEKQQNNLHSEKNLFIKNDLKQEIYKIAQENLIMFKRLIECRKSLYNKQKLLKDYRQSQTYKKNACKYPSINFYKTQKTSYYFATLNSPTHKPLLNFNNIFNFKHKIPLKKRNMYKNLFFTKKIADINENNNNNNNKTSKLFLDNINTNYNTQKKVNQYYKTYYALKDNYDNPYQNTNYIHKNNIFNSENFKTNFNNNINDHPINLFKRGKSEKNLFLDNKNY